MILPLLLLLAGPAQKADDPPVRIDLNHEQFNRGDRARVYVQTVQDGHLVVLHADPDGRVRVLFPRDPSDDDFVRGGQRVEIRGRTDRSAFFVDAQDGSGTVAAVLSPDALSYDTFVRNDHWDFRALGATDVRNDPLAGLLDIARRMTGESHFEYDAATYVVGGGIAANYGYGSHHYGSGYDGFGYPSRFGIGLSFGYPGYYSWGYDPFCYDPFWGWNCGSRFGFGYSAYYFGRPYYYRPYYYRPFAYSRFGGFGRSVAGGTRFVIPRDRVRVTGIQPRSRGGGSSGRGPSVSRPSGGSRGSSGARSGGGGRSGGSRGGGGGRRP